MEYRLDGIKQIQINPKAGPDLPGRAPIDPARRPRRRSSSARCATRETARIAADASITGHLVLSTLHTTRAAAAPVRLIDMGVEPYLVASALSWSRRSGWSAQLCEECAEPVAERGRGLPPA